MFLVHIHSHLLYLLLDCLSIGRLSLLMLYSLILSCLFYFGEYCIIFLTLLFFSTFLGGLVLGYLFFCKKNKDALKI